MESYSNHENSTNKRNPREVNVKSIDTENKETGNSHMERDNNDLKKLKGVITSTINSLKKDISQ